MEKQISRRAFLKKSLKVTGLTIAVSITPSGFKSTRKKSREKIDYI